MRKEDINQSNDKPEFIMVHYDILVDERLTPTDKFVYGVVCWFVVTKRLKRCVASNITIGGILNTSPTVVSNSLAKLEKHGYLRREFSDAKQRKRAEIIPLVGVTKLQKNILNNTSRVSSDSETQDKNVIHQTVKLVSSDSETKTPKKTSKRHSSDSETVSSDSETQNENGFHQTVKLVSSNSETPILKKKDEENKADKGEIDKNEENGFHQVMKRERSKREIFRENLPDHLTDGLGNEVKKDGVFTKLVEGEKLYESPDEISDKDISTGISFFLPVFPSQFVNKNPFGVMANRNAVRKALMRLTLDELKDIVNRYVEKKGDKFRPEANTIATFCDLKLDRIEAFIGKSDNKLWAQRSISTPEQSKVRDDQYNEVIRKNREKAKRLREEWLAEHPEENNKQNHV